MYEPTDLQIELGKKLWEIKEDKSFLAAVLSFAIELECEQVLIDAIHDGDLESENDFYELMRLSFEEATETK